MTITARSGNQTIVVDPKLERFLQKVLDKVAPVTKRALAEAANEIDAQVVANSPVKTGKFRDSWIKGVRIVNVNTIEGFVANTDPKARFIRRPWPARGFVFRSLLFKPGRKKAKELAETLAPELVKAV
tara:strand:- start:52 stop:435 length:384 start_codon:yes stop_codon:yes gene_type:complete